MRREELKNDDILRHYMNAGDAEKAPEGFSSKVMTHIYMEAKPVKREKSYLVLVIYASVFLSLTLASLFLPHTAFTLPEISLPENLGFSFPELGSGTNIPGTILYVIAGITAIAVFDTALNKLFRKGN